MVIKSMLKASLLLTALFVLPITSAANAEDNGDGSGGDSGISCPAPGDVEREEINCPEGICGCDYEPYVPTECELRMWDIYAAADEAVQNLFTQPICEELVANWNIGGGDVADSGLEAFETVNGFVGEFDNGGKRKNKKRLISEKKLRKLKRQANRCIQ